MNSEINPILERQLLLQLGDRLKRLRKAQRISTVQMASFVGCTRNTLRSIENGDSSPSIGSYLKVMSVLGVSGELALLAGDTLLPATKNSAAARSQSKVPLVEVRVSLEGAKHEIQDLQSLILHEEAVRLVKENPQLIVQVKQTLFRWMEKRDSRSMSLWYEWKNILESSSWRKVLGKSRNAQQLRQASPLVTILPEDVRKKILKEVIDLKKGIEFSNNLVRE